MKDKADSKGYSFTVPKDWDKPSPENALRCSHFQKGEFELNGIYMPYRYFTPRLKDGERVPLVLFLHGADTTGTDNENHIIYHDVATIFADEKWQREKPCFVLAPQYHRGSYWSMPETVETVGELVRDFLKRFPAIDPQRIYLYGFSAGGVGVFAQLKAYPRRFAAALAICGATAAKDLENLKETPLWMLHAADDSIVKVSYLEGDENWIMMLGSRDLYEKLKGTPDWDLRYTEYPAGYMKEHFGVHAHCSWVNLSEKEGKELREWLFSKRRSEAELETI